MFRLLLNLRFSFFISLLLCSVNIQAKQYYTWIDKSGDLHNSFLEREAITQGEVERYRSISLSDFVSEDNRIAGVGLQVNPKAPKEQKRKYFTWVEADGRTNNTEYASVPQKVENKKIVIQGGELADDFIDGDLLAKKGFLRDGSEKPYYTWVDPTGRLITSEYKPGPDYSSVSTAVIDYTDGQEFVYNESDVNQIASLGALVPAMNAEPQTVISVDKKLVLRLREVCCNQIPDSEFLSLSSSGSVYEKITKLSPSYEFPTGTSHYLPISLPVSQQSYGLKIKSFAQKGLFYPVLLFLDEDKEPLRYVTDSVVEYHPESWDRYAYLEGRIQIKPSSKERYVLIFTTESDLDRVIDQHKSYASLKGHEHSKLGNLEVSLIY